MELRVFQICIIPLQPCNHSSHTRHPEKTPVYLPPTDSSQSLCLQKYTVESEKVYGNEKEEEKVRHRAREFYLSMRSSDVVCVNISQRSKRIHFPSFTSPRLLSIIWPFITPSLWNDDSLNHHSSSWSKRYDFSPWHPLPHFLRKAFKLNAPVFPSVNPSVSHPVWNNNHLLWLHWLP